MSEQEAAKRSFAEPLWPAHRVIAWIAFRDPAQIDANWKAAKMYPAHASARLVDRNPRTTLLRALRHDNLRAIKDGKELPRELWAGPSRDWSAVYFRREDVLAMWPDPSAEAADHFTFKEIARRWSKSTGEPSDVMMSALVSAFWRSMFERGDISQVFILQPPVGPTSPSDDPFKELPGQYAYSGGVTGAVTKIAQDGEHYLTTERSAGRIHRRDAALQLGGIAELIPWRWDGTDTGLAAYADVPYASWPAAMRKGHFEKWRLSRDDFAKWYAGPATIWPKAPIEGFWPAESPEPLNLVGASAALKPGRKIRSHAPRSTKVAIESAAQPLIKAGRTPTTCGSWEIFRRELCDRLGVQPSARGYGEDTVQNAVRPLLRAHPQTEKTEN